MSRRNGGRETWDRLLYWDRGQADSERLSGHILNGDGYESLDPSHPLGGPDGGKDIICKKDGLIMVGACYFPRGEQKFSDIKAKFLSDLKGVEKNDATGIIFITNQQMTLGERKELTDLCKDYIVDIYHLERIASILDNPVNYGIRLDFLDIEFTKEEILAFQAVRDKEYYERIEKINKSIENVTAKLEKYVDDIIGYSRGGDSFGYIGIVPDLYDQDVIEMVFNTNSKYPLYNIDIGMVDSSRFNPAHVNAEIEKFHIDEIAPNSSKTLGKKVNLKEKEEQKYHFRYVSRTGFYNQKLNLYKIDGFWLMALRVENGFKVVYEYIDSSIPSDTINW